ncbi:ATP-binding cassette domain-containing protein [soil metagenome]
MHFVTKNLLGREKRRVQAVNGISFEIARGETLGLVGESGCGKSTAGRAVLNLIQPSAGTVEINGRHIGSLSPSQMRPLRRHAQMVFQDPYSSLNPRMRVGALVAEPLENYAWGTRQEIAARVAELLVLVGLPAESASRFPHEFSGGQRQRVAIARALALSPTLIVCDEAVSALDVSVQAQIVNLLRRLQQQLGVAYLFIAHDIAIVEHVSHRIGVMHLGEIVELAPRDSILTAAQHPYTQALLSAVPVPDPSRAARRKVLKGDLPSPASPPTGCRFRTRCPLAFNRCATEAPLLREVLPGHTVACHLREAGPAPADSFIRSGLMGEAIHV